MTNFIYLDNVIFHSRLSDRNYGCRRRPIYLIFSQFSIYCCQNAFASEALPRTPPGGFQRPPAGKCWVSPLERAPQNCGPQGPETPRSATVGPHRGASSAPQLANVGSHHWRGPHRIAGPRAPRPHDPPLFVSAVQFPFFNLINCSEIKWVGVLVTLPCRVVG